MLAALVWLALPAAFAEARGDAGVYVVARPDALGRAWSKVGLPLAMHPGVARALSRAKDALGFSPLDEQAFRDAGLRWASEAVITIGEGGHPRDDDAFVEVVVEVIDPARWEAQRKAAPGSMQAMRRGRFAVYSTGRPGELRTTAAPPGLGRWLTDDAPLRAFAPAQRGCAGEFALSVRPRAGGLAVRGAWNDAAALAFARPLAALPPKTPPFFWMAVPRVKALRACHKATSAEDPLLEARQAPHRFAEWLERLALELGETPTVSVAFDAPQGPPKIAAGRGRATAAMRIAIARWLDALPRAEDRVEAIARSWLGQHFPAARATLSLASGALVCELLVDVQ